MDSERISGREKNILVSSCFGHFLSHYNMLAFPALVLPLSASLGLSVPDVLKISFYMYLFFGVSALPWGIVADRIGARPLFYIFFAGAGICGTAASFCVDSPMRLTVCLAGIGIFSGIYHPVGLGLISKEVNRLSMALGINGMFGNIGLASAPLCTGLINWLSGPEAAYLFLGGLNLAGIAVLWLFPIEESAGKSESVEANGAGKLSLFMILLIAMTLGGVVYRAGTVVTPTLFELNTNELFEFISTLSEVSVSPNLIATISTSLIFLVGVIAQYSGGRAAEKYSPQYSYIIFHLITIPLAFIIPFSSNMALVFGVGLYFFFLLGMQPSENTLVARIVPKNLLHSSYGLKFILTFGVGSLSVKGAGVISDTYGIGAVYTAMGVCSMVLVSVIFVLILNLGKSETEPLAEARVESN